MIAIKGVTKTEKDILDSAGIIRRYDLSDLSSKVVEIYDLILTSNVQIKTEQEGVYVINITTGDTFYMSELEYMEVNII